MSRALRRCDFPAKMASTYDVMKSVIAELKEAFCLSVGIDGWLRAGWSPQSGWLVVRASGTEPMIWVMAEGDDPTMVISIVDNFVASLSEAAA